MAPSTPMTSRYPLPGALHCTGGTGRDSYG